MPSIVTGPEAMLANSCSGELDMFCSSNKLKPGREQMRDLTGQACKRCMPVGKHGGLSAVAERAKLLLER
jgi:hypothetical protein